MNKELSIIIPHYNSPQTLSALLDTIGIHDDVEIIVIDDNSTKYYEEYMTCMQRYEKCVTFLRNDPSDRNAGSARNVGIDAAKGKWLLFADADDYFVADWYTHVKEYFNDYQNDIIHFPISENDTLHQDSVKKAVRRYNLLCSAWLENVKHSDTMIRIYFYAPWSKMIRHSLVNDYGIRFDSIRYSNDILFSTKVGIYAKKVTVSNNPIYFHTITEGSLSTIGTEEAYYIKQISYCKRCDFLYDNLDHNEWKTVNNNEGIRRIVIAIKRRYGVKNVLKYFKMYREHHVPIFTFKRSEITQLKKMINRKKREKKVERGS